MMKSTKRVGVAERLWWLTTVLVILGYGADQDSLHFFNGEVIVAAADTSSSLPPPNILLIITNQQRFDALGRVQDELMKKQGIASDAGSKAHVHILQTPGLDDLSNEGVFFRNAYTQSPNGDAAHTTLRTGCTIERTGVESSDQSEWDTTKISQLKTIDAILKEKAGYTSEYYGAWHLPDSFRSDLNNNHYDPSTGAWEVVSDSWDTQLQAYLNAVDDAEKNDPSRPLSSDETWQVDPYLTGQPYFPLALDSRFESLSNTTLFDDSSFPPLHRRPDSVLGPTALNENHTSSAYITRLALQALDRLQPLQDGDFSDEKPWFLTVSYHHPQPPMTPVDSLYAKYWHLREYLPFVPPPNHNDPLTESAYNELDSEALLKVLDEMGYYNNITNLQQWTAAYYALVEEVDRGVAEILNHPVLSPHNSGGAETLVVFTSSHGELLGAHRGMRGVGVEGTGTLFEEVTHVPLMMKLPGQTFAGTVVNDPVSHLDVAATILDYAGALDGNDSHFCDGQSLRRFAEGTNFNEDHDEAVAVAEMTTQSGDQALITEGDTRSTFAVWYKGWKLVMHKLSSSTHLDMLYHLDSDPYELTNRIGPSAQNSGFATNDGSIAKAEHLRVLLLEWMQRMDGKEEYYSDPKYNGFIGEGDMAEISSRQAWLGLDLWTSELPSSSMLQFGNPVWDGTSNVRKEYVYLGRRTAGSTSITSIELMGTDTAYYTLNVERITPSPTRGPIDSTVLSPKDFRIEAGQYIRIQVTYSNPSQVLASDTNLIISTPDMDGNSMNWKVSFGTSNLNQPTPSPTIIPTPSPTLPMHINYIPLSVDVRPCSWTDQCQRCEGGCRYDEDCEGTLVCTHLNQENKNIPGCIGLDHSTLEWCVDPPMLLSPVSLPPAFLPTPPTPTTTPAPATSSSPPPPSPSPSPQPTKESETVVVKCDQTLMNCAGELSSDGINMRPLDNPGYPIIGIMESASPSINLSLNGFVTSAVIIIIFVHWVS